MCVLLNSVVRQCSSRLRSAALDAGSGDGHGKEVEAEKEIFRESVFKVVTAHLGSLPAEDDTFKWDYRDENGKAHVWEGTPREFYRVCKDGRLSPDSHSGGGDMRTSDTVNLIHDTRKREGTVLQSERPESMWGGRRALSECLSRGLFHAESLDRNPDITYVVASISNGLISHSL